VGEGREKSEGISKKPVGQVVYHKPLYTGRARERGAVEVALGQTHLGMSSQYARTRANTAMLHLQLRDKVFVYCLPHIKNRDMRVSYGGRWIW